MKKITYIHARSRKRGFSLIELLVVVGIITILMGFIIAMVGAGKRAADSAKCAKVLQNLTAAWYLYVGENDQLMAWSGRQDGNYFSDWVWGGQNRDQLENPGAWTQAGFGFHPEAGAMFPHVTGLPIHRLEDPGRVRQGRNYKSGKPDTNRKEEYREYRCPNSGEYELLAEAQRVNYSINSYVDYYEYVDEPTRTEDEEYLVNVRRPAQKLLYADEDPRSMKNSSIHPGGSADDTNYDGTTLFSTHADKVNITFIDGHFERWSKEEMLVKQRNKGQKINVDGNLLTAEENYVKKHWYPRTAEYE
jgi:prepilin-type N-terminal cleavage/methylation domain-containing protein/prepilin-type processing-associated H-X9-DG protein